MSRDLEETVERVLGEAIRKREAAKIAALQLQIIGLNARGDGDKIAVVMTVDDVGLLLERLKK